MSKRGRGAHGSWRGSVLSRTVKRSQGDGLRAVYEHLLDYEVEHLRNCALESCPECGEARLLIRYYREELARIPRDS